MSIKTIFKMEIVQPKEKTCSACNKKKTNTCETVKDAKNCDELKKKTETKAK